MKSYRKLRLKKNKTKNKKRKNRLRGGDRCVCPACFSSRAECTDNLDYVISCPKCNYEGDMF